MCFIILHFQKFTIFRQKTNFNFRFHKKIYTALLNSRDMDEIIVRIGGAAGDGV
jgi:hypothetical protein